MHSRRLARKLLWQLETEVPMPYSPQFPTHLTFTSVALCNGGICLVTESTGTRGEVVHER
jgi:hypothetical protein